MSAEKPAGRKIDGWRIYLISVAPLFVIAMLGYITETHHPSDIYLGLGGAFMMGTSAGLLIGGFFSYLNRIKFPKRRHTAPAYTERGGLQKLSSFALRTFRSQEWIYSIVGDPEYSLKRASFDVLPDEYSAVMIMVSLIVAFISLAAGFVFYMIHELPLYVVPFAALASFFLTAFLMRAYPGIVISGNASIINLNLPFIVSEMASLSDSGMTLEKISEVMYEIGHEKAIKNVFMHLNKDLKVLGMDIFSALDDVASRSPSPELQNFLKSLKTALLSGSDVSGFLKEYTDKLMVDRKISLKYLTERLNVLAEAFTTIFIVLPVMLVIMLLLMLMISVASAGSIYLYLLVVIYVLIPLLGLIFVMMVEALGPR
ncbi:MAG: type II secretion system F family protein [Nitrososphaeria archaeon]